MNPAEHVYGTLPTAFAAGDRVELHPACDLWMRGARYGTVEKVLKVFVIVRVDRTGRAYRFLACDLRKVG